MTSLTAAILTVLAVAQQGERPAEPARPAAPIVHIGAAQARRGIVRIAVPWPRGVHRELSALRIGEDLAPCVTTLRWPDGSAAVTLAHVRAELREPGESALPVEVVAAPAKPVAEPPFALDGDVPLQTTLEDLHGRRYIARLSPDPAAESDALLSSSRVRVRSFRGLHARPVEGGVEVLLAAQAWLIEFAGEARAELTLVLDGDPRLGEPVSGPVRIASFALEATRPDIELVLRAREAQGRPPATRGDDGRWRQALIVPSDLAYLGDRCGKTFRIDVLSTSAAPEAQREARAALVAPLVGFAALDSVRATAAFGAFGGPAPRASALEPPARTRVLAWQDRGGSSGLFAPFGDVFDPSRDPSRDAPSALHDALRWRSHELLELGLHAAAQQTLRPTPSTEPRYPAETAHLREGLGPRARRRPHGWAALGYETFAVELLYDAYWLTGDPLARHELARAGSGLLGLLRQVEYRTSRGEGLALRAGVLIARATADANLLAALAVHARTVILPALAEAPRGTCFPQPGHPRALGSELPFDSTEQMAQLVLGLAALGDALQAPELRAAAVDVARRIATDGWLEGHGPAAWISARAFQVRLGPSGDAARSGLLGALSAAFVIAHGIAGSEDDRSRFDRRVEELRQDPAMPPLEATLGDPWFQLVHDRRRPIR